MINMKISEVVNREFCKTCKKSRESMVEGWVKKKKKRLYRHIALSGSCNEDRWKTYVHGQDTDKLAGYENDLEFLRQNMIKSIQEGKLCACYFDQLVLSQDF